MAFAVMTLDDQHTFLLALTKVLLGGDVSEDSFMWLWSRTQAAGVTDNHANINATKNDLLPDTAADDMADRWGTISGVPRKGATGSRKEKAGRVFGTPGTAVTIGLEIDHSSGLRFQITNADVVGADNFVDMDIAAIDTGSATRLNAGEQLTFAATPSGLQDTVILQLALDEDGTDKESDGALQQRILARWSSPPLGGAQSDYVAWALSMVGIATAYCYPIRAGLGSVDLAALHAGSGDARMLLAGEITALQTLINGLRPVGVTFRVLTVFTTGVDVELLILPTGALNTEFDWDDTVPPTCTAFNAGTRQLTFSTIPPDLIPGDRIVIKHLAGGNTGVERIVESLAGGNNVILEAETGGDDPANTDVLYSGGPLVAPTRAAIQAVFDSLGTANPDSIRYGDWEGNLDPGALQSAALGVAGVLRASVTTPAALVAANDPAYPADNTIELLKAGRILVRRNH